MLGTTELIIILLIIIVVFGSTKLPQLGDALGKSIKNFKSAMDEGKKEDSQQENPDSQQENSENSNKTK